MFENLTATLIQLVGFLGVFAFFVFQLFSEKKNSKVINNKLTNMTIESKNRSKKGLFRQNNQKVEDTNIKPKKRGWFS